MVTATTFRRWRRSRSQSITPSRIAATQNRMCWKNMYPNITRKELMRRNSNSSHGFTLIEMSISAAIGLALITAAAQLYSKALTVSMVTSQRAQLQQDFRAATNLLQRDISMAGAGALGQQGLSNGAVGLPVSATLPVYPCSGLTTCNYISGAPVAYPRVLGAP